MIEMDADTVYHRKANSASRDIASLIGRIACVCIYIYICVCSTRR